MNNPYIDQESCIMIAAPKREHHISYASGEELISLIKILCTSAVELSVGVRAQAPPEFWKLRSKAKKEWNSARYIRALIHNNHVKEENERILEEQAEALRIMPFNVQHYRFSPGYGRNLLKIRSEFRAGLEYPEISEMMHLVLGWRLCFVSLRDALEQEHMETVPQWIMLMHDQGYEPSWVRARLNPADWYDTEIVRYNSAEIVARKGLVTARGITLEREPTSLEELTMMLG